MNWGPPFAEIARPVPPPGCTGFVHSTIFDQYGCYIIQHPMGNRANCPFHRKSKP